MGCLDQPYHIKTGDAGQSIICPPQNIPERVSLRRNWQNGEVGMNSLVVVEKPKTGKLRLCLNPRLLTK